MSESISAPLIPGLLPPPNVILEHAFAGGLATALVAPISFLYEYHTVTEMKDKHSNRWIVVPNNFERPEGRPVRSQTYRPAVPSWVRGFAAVFIPSAAARWVVYATSVHAISGLTSTDGLTAPQQHARSSTHIPVAMASGCVSGYAEYIIERNFAARAGVLSASNVALSAETGRQKVPLMQYWSPTAFNHGAAMRGVNVGTCMGTYTWLTQAWRHPSTSPGQRGSDTADMTFAKRWKAGALSAVAGTAIQQITDRIFAPLRSSSVQQEAQEQIAREEARLRAQLAKAVGRQKNERQILDAKAKLAKYVRETRLRYDGATPRTMSTWLSVLGWDMLKAALLGGTVIAVQDALVHQWL